MTSRSWNYPTSTDIINSKTDHSQVVEGPISIKSLLQNTLVFLFIEKNLCNGGVDRSFGLSLLQLVAFFSLVSQKPALPIVPITLCWYCFAPNPRPQPQPEPPPLPPPQRHLRGGGEIFFRFKRRMSKIISTCYNSK